MGDISDLAAAEAEAGISESYGPEGVGYSDGESIGGWEATVADGGSVGTSGQTTQAPTDDFAGMDSTTAAQQLVALEKTLEIDVDSQAVADAIVASQGFTASLDQNIAFTKAVIAQVKATYSAIMPDVVEDFINKAYNTVRDYITPAIDVLGHAKQAFSSLMRGDFKSAIQHGLVAAGAFMLGSFGAGLIGGVGASLGFNLTGSVYGAMIGFMSGSALGAKFGTDIGGIIADAIGSKLTGDFVTDVEIFGSLLDPGTISDRILNSPNSEGLAEGLVTITANPTIISDNTEKIYLNDPTLSSVYLYFQRTNIIGSAIYNNPVTI